MNAENGALKAALARALAAPEGASLAAAIPMPAQTLLVVDPGVGDDAAALRPLVEALARQGIPRGRLDVVVASRGDADAERRCARALGRALGPGVVHVRDPEHGDHFTAGVLLDAAVEIDDVAREAEAVIVVSADRPGESPWSVVIPGLASMRTARALATSGWGAGGTGGEAPGRIGAVLGLVPVDWAVRFARTATVGGVRVGTPAHVWSDAPAS